MYNATTLKNEIIEPLKNYIWGDVVSRTQILQALKPFCSQMAQSNNSLAPLFEEIWNYGDSLSYQQNIGDFFHVLGPFLELLLLKKNQMDPAKRNKLLKKQISELRIILSGGELDPSPPEPAPPQYSFSYTFTQQDEEALDYSAIVEDPSMVDTYRDEAEEFLGRAQGALLDLEHDNSNPECINQVFRCFHTLKSSSAFLGFKNIEVLAHHMENLLGQMRKGELIITPLLTDIIFHGMGLIRDLLRVIETSDYKSQPMIQGFKAYKLFPYINLVERISAEHHSRKIGDILKEMGSLNQGDLDNILKRQKQDKRFFGDIAIEDQVVSPEELQTALNLQNQQRQRQSFVRVSSPRLNQLVDLVGELVVNQSMVRQLLQQDMGGSDQAVDQLESITTSIKDIVLSMGMVPMDEMFQKLRVVVRNTARDLNKLVNFEVIGAETEMDRNLVESIYDPLVHMVRNSVSHGIETPQEREDMGKSRVGNITLSAQYRGNGIEVSVKDDGAGIDPQRVVDKALALGMIKREEAEEYLEDSSKVYSLLFKPGFSTKESADSISGRGVGMDVVMQNINRVNGKVDLFSKKGQGTTFQIKLPLTLAIIDGFVTEIMGERYVLPFEVVEEILVYKDVTLVPMEKEAPMILSRERYLPLMDLHRLLTGADGVYDEPFVYILANHEDSRMAIPVNRVLGKQEIVIKNLNELIRSQKLFSGGTIFGDGSIGFILDFEELTRRQRLDELEEINPKDLEPIALQKINENEINKSTNDEEKRP
ncbi:MAG: chemotaxis protein CheA [Spirochaetaceae bacterium]|jgi:two-component system chemotaxis sensor kinase CheA|nr:chemotaxis protein CheA [Spirochaetaceae bacterium]